jgi:hypothetical protein
MDAAELCVELLRRDRSVAVAGDHTIQHGAGGGLLLR